MRNIFLCLKKMECNEGELLMTEFPFSGELSLWGEKCRDYRCNIMFAQCRLCDRLSCSLPASTGLVKVNQSEARRVNVECSISLPRRVILTSSRQPCLRRGTNKVLKAQICTCADKTR